MNSQKDTYRSFEEYKYAIEHSIKFSLIIIMQLSRYSIEIREKIISNFIAKSSGLMESIVMLWEIKNYGNCWILFRSLVDRIIHLWYLDKTNTFKEFNDWTFIKKFEANNRAKSDPLFNKQLVHQGFKVSKEQIERYQILKAKKIIWERPRPEDIAKEKKLSFVYHYGYDFASTKIHPMSDDGMEDINRLTGLEWDNMQLENPYIVLNNSLGIYVVLLQESMNVSGFKWLKLLHTYIQDITDFLNTGSNNYLNTYMKIFELERQGFRFCE